MKVLKDLEMEKNTMTTEDVCMIDFNLGMTRAEELNKALADWSTAELVHLGRT
jgi:hypothetical protein